MHIPRHLHALLHGRFRALCYPIPALYTYPEDCRVSDYNLLRASPYLAHVAGNRDTSVGILLGIHIHVEIILLMNS